jgi:hypothetical protein
LRVELLTHLHAIHRFMISAASSFHSSARLRILHGSNPLENPAGNTESRRDIEPPRQRIGNFRASRGRPPGIMNLTSRMRQDGLMPARRSWMFDKGSNNVLVAPVDPHGPALAVRATGTNSALRGFIRPRDLVSEAMTVFDVRLLVSVTWSNKSK